MKSIDLIPADGRRSGSLPRPSLTRAPAYVLLGFLAAALGLMTLYVLAGNTISSKQATLASVKVQVSQAQARAAGLGNFSKFTQVAQTRVQTVQSIAAARFDWHAAFADLSKVVPANTSLQTLNASIVAGTGGGSSSLRGALPGPAIDMTGCTVSQDDVAALMSRLRLINGVIRVSLSTSQEATTATTSSSSSGPARGCPAHGPTFDIVVFFNPVQNAGANGVTAVSGSTSTAGAAG